MKLTHLVVATVTLAAATACSDQTIATEAVRSASGSVASADMGGTTQRMVSMMDACDGPSFAAQNPPIPCTRNGGVSFNDLIAQLIDHGSAGAWHNAPSMMDAKVGLTLTAVNNGGEVHSFTRVAKFGGGVVPEINALLHLTPAPECLAETNFVPPGGADSDDIVRPGITLYQCCIHPWMQTVVNGKA